jgi:hypothetical protein
MVVVMLVCWTTLAIAAATELDRVPAAMASLAHCGIAGIQSAGRAA